jgi:hypothetical protein
LPKVHNIGKNYFVQYFRFPAKWGIKVIVRGETQEIVHPFRLSKPFMIRLPFYRVLVIGKWAGQQPDEETALHKAMQGRVLKDEDFEEGWTPAAYKNSEEGSKHLHS